MKNILKKILAAITFIPRAVIVLVAFRYYDYCQHRYNMLTECEGDTEVLAAYTKEYSDKMESIDKIVDELWRGKG